MHHSHRIWWQRRYSNTNFYYLSLTYVPTSVQQRYFDPVHPAHLSIGCLTWHPSSCSSAVAILPQILSGICFPVIIFVLKLEHQNDLKGTTSYKLKPSPFCLTSLDPMGLRSDFSLAQYLTACGGKRFQREDLQLAVSFELTC
jgi:hypothetical protein